MVLEDAVKTKLSNDTNVTTFVSTRIYLGNLASGTAYPAIRIMRLEAVRNVSQDGPPGLCTATIQIDCFGDTYSSARNDVFEAVRKSLDGFSGLVSTFTIEMVALGTDQDLYDTTLTKHHVRSEFLVSHLET